MRYVSNVMINVITKKRTESKMLLSSVLYDFKKPQKNERIVTNNSPK